MSLKGFHLVFVSVCILMALALGVWAIRDYGVSHESFSLGLAIGSLAAAPALLLYGRWFLRKLEKVDYT